MNAWDIIEILNSLLGSRAAENASNEVRYEAIDLLDSLFKIRLWRKMTKILLTRTISELQFYKENAFLIKVFDY